MTSNELTQMSIMLVSCIFDDSIEFFLLVGEHFQISKKNQVSSGPCQEDSHHGNWSYQLQTFTDRKNTKKELG